MFISASSLAPMGEALAPVNTGWLAAIPLGGTAAAVVPVCSLIVGVVAEVPGLQRETPGTIRAPPTGRW